MIDVDSKTLENIKKILKNHVPEYEVRVFGSRVKGQAKEFSDIDLVIVGKKEIDWRVIENLKDVFSESNIPYIVDIVDWHHISDEFKDIIDEKYVVISDGSRI